MKFLNAYHIVLLIHILALLGIVIALRLLAYSARIDYTAEAFSESTEPIKNPYCGFYRIIGYTLSDDYIPSDNSYCEVDSYNESLVLVEINLKNYRTCEISEKGLQS